jgi:hypothetical protein
VCGGTLTRNDKVDACAGDACTAEECCELKKFCDQLPVACVAQPSPSAGTYYRDRGEAAVDTGCFINQCTVASCCEVWRPETQFGTDFLKNATYVEWYNQTAIALARQRAATMAANGDSSTTQGDGNEQLNGEGDDEGDVTAEGAAADGDVDSQKKSEEKAIFDKYVEKYKDASLEWQIGVCVIASVILTIICSCCRCGIKCCKKRREKMKPARRPLSRGRRRGDDGIMRLDDRRGSTSKRRSSMNSVTPLNSEPSSRRSSVTNGGSRRGSVTSLASGSRRWVTQALAQRIFGSHYFKTQAHF